MKNKSVNILIFSLLLLGIMAVMLIVFIDKAHDDFKDDIRVNAGGVTEEILTVRELKLNPTEKKEYEIRLTCQASGSFYIFLDYEESDDGGMKPFVDVTVRCNDTVVYEGKLSELLDNDKIIEFEETLDSTKPLPVLICYEMPYCVGNEAQGTYADFDIHLKIEKS